MNLKLLVVFFLFSSISFFCQTQINVSKKVSKNFYYSLKYIRDSTNKNSISEDYFRLNVSDSVVVFSSVNNLRRDSIMDEIKSDFDKFGGNINFSSLPRAQFFYYILKNSNTHNIRYYDKIGSDNFFYEENVNTPWVLSSSTKMYNGYNCQKAEVEIFGRKFVAWFTKDIPFAEGPYKFRGLPGLIVEVYDTDKAYHFQLVKYFSEEPIPNIVLPKTRIFNIKQVKKEDFLKGHNNHFQNRAHRVRASFNVDESRIREIEENIKSYNNPLELNP